MLKEFMLNRRLKKNNIELVEISDEALEQYKRCIRNNSNEDPNIMKMKLNRNFLVATIIRDTEKVLSKQYGNLTIHYDKTTKQIKSIYNVKGGLSFLNREMLHKKKELNKIMGIN